jgi:hypothetical protein
LVQGGADLGIVLYHSHMADRQAQTAGERSPKRSSGDVYRVQHIPIISADVDWPTGLGGVR